MRKTSFVLGPLSVARSDRPQAKDDGAGTTDKELLTKDVFFRIHYSPFTIQPSAFILHPSHFTLHTSFTSAIGYKRPAIAEANESGEAVFSFVHKSVIASIS